MFRCCTHPAYAADGPAPPARSGRAPERPGEGPQVALTAAVRQALEESQSAAERAPVPLRESPRETGRPDAPLGPEPSAGATGEEACESDEEDTYQPFIQPLTPSAKNGQRGRLELQPAKSVSSAHARDADLDDIDRAIDDAFQDEKW